MDNKDASSADPAAAPEPASDPRDPGIIDFRIREFSLSGPAAAHSLTPYESLCPGLWVGFQEGARVRMRQGTAADGRRGMFLSLDPGPSAWLSIEMQLDAEGLVRSGVALATLEAAASPLVNINMVLRMPRAGSAKGFWDTRPETAVFGPDVSRKSLAFFPQLSHMIPHDGFPDPLLIAFLPLRKTDLFLSGIRVGPVR
ncbi:hypothetical protein QO034_15710 [Sedimentitalea sp. JM2-8]|uniref:Uncharacterized protein n=1 Tax=Sedimentitalea xiamensis TaxID=3050037 RepID=A0ABT7FHB9_9RHOB|nr:hypothetical protein [Sedimentitalea xiamensis]MDK3074544.1 hypothetical protein [Sedimentitalea xiamensis]